MNNYPRTLIHLTPELAREYLDKNHPGNRKIRKGTVMRYAADIKSGRWNSQVSQVDQPILLDQQGRLIQGQHRCSAVIEAGIPINVYACIGVPDEFYDYLDGGLARTAGDFLNTKRATRVASLVSSACAIDDGSLSLKMAVAGKFGAKKGIAYMTPRVMIINKFNHDKEYFEGLMETANTISKKTRLLNTSIAIALHIIYFVERDVLIDEFVDDFAQDGGPDATSNKLLINFCLNLAVKKRRHTRADDVSYILSAYDLFCDSSNAKSFNKYIYTFKRYDELVQEKRDGIKEDN